MRISLFQFCLLWLCLLLLCTRPSAYPGSEKIISRIKQKGGVVFDFDLINEELHQRVNEVLRANSNWGSVFQDKSKVSGALIESDYYFFTLGNEKQNKNLLPVGVLGNWILLKRSMFKWGVDEDVLFMLLLVTISFCISVVLPERAHLLYFPNLNRPWSLFLNSTYAPNLGSLVFFMVTILQIAHSVRNLCKHQSTYYLLLFASPCVGLLFSMLLTWRPTALSMGSTSTVLSFLTFALLKDPKYKTKLFNTSIVIGYLGLYIVQVCLYLILNPRVNIVKLVIPVLGVSMCSVAIFFRENSNLKLEQVIYKTFGV